MPETDTDTRRWWLTIGAVACGAVLLRAVYVLVVARHLTLGADATWYLLQGGSIRDRTGFVDPELLLSAGRHVPTANFPPLYPTYLALVQLVAGRSETVAQLSGALGGAVTVVLTAVLARRFTSDRRAVLAAVVVAVSPILVVADGSLMSEALYVPLVVGAVLAAHVAGSGPRLWPWVALGLACGAAALTRSESVLLVPLLILPTVWWSRESRRSRLVGVLLAVAAVVVVVSPWMLRNSQQLGQFTISTVSPDTALAGANCDATYYGGSIGSWEYRCTRPDDRRRLGEQEWGRQLRSEARRYISEHRGRLVVVVPARELRVWGLWDPADLAARDAEETRSESFQWLVLGWGLVSLVGGVVGLARLSRGRRPAVVLWAPVAMVTAVAAISHGNPRFRTVAEPMLAIGLAVALAVIVAALRRPGWRT